MIAMVQISGSRRSFTGAVKAAVMRESSVMGRAPLRHMRRGGQWCGLHDCMRKPNAGIMKRSDGQDRSITARWRPATQAVRGGTWRSEMGETSEALFLTSGYTYDDAATVAARFAGEADGMTYSRVQNPTVAMLEERIALLEGAEACRAQASGMAAMTTALLCQLSVGDHVVAAKAAFGSCRWLIDNLLPRFGITGTTIDASDNAAWEAAIRPNTKVFFFESPANPTMDVVDLEFVCSLARARTASPPWSTTRSPPARCSARSISARMWLPIPPPR